MTWRVATSLDVLLDEINAGAPHRSKVSDGSIGDEHHATRDSDHNPWVRKGGLGIVRARDFTHDPDHGCDGHALAEQLARLIRAGAHPALRSGAYVIWNRRILSRDRVAEGWRDYHGTNPHTHHLHLSVTTDPAGFDSAARWDATTPPVAAIERMFRSLTINPPGAESELRLLEAIGQTWTRTGRLEADVATLRAGVRRLQAQS